MNRADFDAASYPWVRQALQQANQALRQAEQADFSGLLAADGEFLPGVAYTRDCPLCDHPAANARQLFRAHGMHIMACASCGFVYSREVLLPGAEQARYRQSQSSQANQVLKVNEAYRFLEQKKAEYVVGRLAQCSQPAALLDVGCSNGTLLEQARRQAWQTYGIELGETAVQSCLEKGLQVVHGSFPQDLPADWPAMDAVTLFDVLEHLPSPRQSLQQMTACLKQGGLLLVQVPNQRSLLLAIEQQKNNNYCHGHWSYFTPRTLQGLLEEEGFACLHLETYISELDRILAYDDDIVRNAWHSLSNDAPQLTAEGLWAQDMGYKVFGIFRRL